MELSSILMKSERTFYIIAFIESFYGLIYKTIYTKAKTDFPSPKIDLVFQFFSNYLESSTEKDEPLRKLKTTSTATFLQNIRIVSLKTSRCTKLFIE